MKKVLSAALAGALIAAAMAVPAVAKGPNAKAKKGKKAIGTVASFDAASGALVADMRNGATFTGQVAPDAKVKLEHRGKPATKGNPTKGSLDDLVAGATLLKMKRRDGVVVKVFLRPLGSTVVDHPGNGGGCKTGDSDDSDSAENESDVTDDSAAGDEAVLDETDDAAALQTDELGDSTEGSTEETVTTEGDDSTEPDAEDCLDPDTGSGDESDDGAAETDAADDGSTGDVSTDDGSTDGGTEVVEEVVGEVTDTL